MKIRSNFYLSHVNESHPTARTSHIGAPFRIAVHLVKVCLVAYGNSPTLPRLQLALNLPLASLQQ